MTNADCITEIILEQRPRRVDRAMLVAISGIDGSGKTTVATPVAEALQAAGLNAALLGLDPWHTPPSDRFDERDPAGNFYRRAYRWDELFGRLVEPLRRDRAVNVTLDLTRLPQNDIVPHTYCWRNVDVIVLEGIFLLKRELRDRYDLSFWLECSFETALARALVRNQEGLSRARLIEDFERIYFAAQRIHFQRDDPRLSADFVLCSDEARVLQEV